MTFNKRSVVSPAEASHVPYPYVYMNKDGTVRELHAKEREYLETLFDPFDGNRPYVKPSFDAKNALGDPQGFCRRSAIPKNLRIAEAPVEDPNPEPPPKTRKEKLSQELHDSFERWGNGKLTVVAGALRAEFSHLEITQMVDWIYKQNSVVIKVFRSNKPMGEDDWVMKIPIGVYVND